MASGDRQVASEWLPVELALPDTEARNGASDDAGAISDREQVPEESVDGEVAVDQQGENGELSPSPGEAGIERLLERAEQTQGALREAEIRTEGAEERTRLTAQAESALERAAAAEATAREAAEIADRLSAKVIVLTDRIAAQEIELKRARWQGPAVVDDVHAAEPEPQLEPEPEPDLTPPQVEHQQPQGEAFDINEASFEELCRLGLSVSQAARLIGQRDQRGGFRSPEDFDRIWGLPPDIIEVLRDAARV